MNNSHRNLHQPSPIFRRGQKCEILSCFWPHSHSEHSDVCRRPRASRPPSPRSICPIGASKVRQLEKRLHRFNSSTREQISQDVLCGSRKAAELSNPLRVESKMANDAQIFNIRTQISLKRLKLETSNLVCASTTSSNFDGMQKN